MKKIVSVVNWIYKEIVKYLKMINWGIAALLVLVIQVLIGILLVLHDVPSISHAFISLEHLSRAVNLDLFWRVIYIFFIVIYAHMIRGLFYGSYMYPRKGLWYTGIIIFKYFTISL